MARYAQRFWKRPALQACVYQGILWSYAIFPVWSQDGDIPDPTADDFTPLPAAISPDDDLPALSADAEANPSELESGNLELSLTTQQSDFLKQSPIQRQRAYSDAISDSEQALKLGRDSFERGLLPLEDYADQTQAALEIRLAVAGFQNDRAARFAALVNHSELMRSAARQLRELDQPAAAGWEADTAYAELLSANADLRLAAARGDRDSYNVAVDRSQKLSKLQYDLRAVDFDQGLAGLPSLSRAASYLTTEVGLPANNRAGEQPEPTKFSEYLSKLADVVEQTTTFADLDAGVGREDRLHQAQFALAKAEGQLALQQKEKQAAAESFGKAFDASQAWYASQVKYYDSGTASLRDITEAWWSRVELSDLAERAGLQAPVETLAETGTQLADLKKLVAAKDDREGRIAADVAYFRSLEKLQGLWAGQRAVNAAAKQAATVKPSAARRPSRVIEIDADGDTRPAPKGVSGTTPVTTQTTPQSTVEIVRPQRQPKK